MSSITDSPVAPDSSSSDAQQEESALMSSSTTSTPSPETGAARRASVPDRLLRYAMLWILAIIVLITVIMYNNFFAFGNLNNLFLQIAPLGIVAVGMTFCIIGGNFDLSAGAVYAGASVAFASMANSMPVWLAFLGTIGIGLLCGVINGLIVTVLKVNSFIATLATASLFLAVANMYSSYSPIVATAGGFDFLGGTQIGGIWVATYVMAIALLVLGLLLSKTKFGRSVYAVGGNREAARLAGIRVNAVQVGTLAITSVCAALGGMIAASQIGVGQTTIGDPIALNAIAIVIIGGTSLLGGEGTMSRTFVGILIWGTISNLFASRALDSATQMLIQGFILILAVAVDSFSRVRGVRN